MEDLCPASSIKHLNKKLQNVQTNVSFGGKGTDGIVIFSKEVTVTKGV